ncbi:dockerin type I domain-containing protein [Methylobacter luteus]|uniref:dockerin type I domain-containing protein n=1 Tax=Methylobacter luteus TaxID=415 RepID=UPI000423F030|nr:dockerin type I domain-containing protein [Methylobacter luteus]
MIQKPFHFIRLSIVATIWGTTLLPIDAGAFVPGGLKGAATGGKSHKQMTRDALDVLYAEYGFGTGAWPLSKTMDYAREQIADANASVDDVYASTSARHCDAENLQACSDLTKSLFQETVDALGNEDAGSARKSLGEAFHTLQDFYSHSNWIELGNNIPHPDLGKGVIANIAPKDAQTCIDAPALDLCFADNLTSSYLTSGYFSDQDRTHLYEPGKKCAHGGSFDHTDGYGGINKDSSTCFVMAGAVPVGVSPHADDNPAASTVAHNATVEALYAIKEQVSDREFKSLLGIGPSLAFAVDTTGSMGSVINGVRTDIQNILNSRFGTPDEPTRYILSPFNDPSTGPLTSTNDSDRFLDALNNLYPWDGGDCPELAMRGEYDALVASDSGGELFMYTDASAKDAYLEPQVSTVAQQKDVKVFNGLYGRCSPYDPAYFAISNSSGGQTFLLQPGKTAGFSQLANLLSRSNAADIMAVAGPLGTTVVDHYFPVDLQTSRITVSVTSTGVSSISVIRPDGSIVSANDPGVMQPSIPTAAGSAKIYSIDAPQSGNWRISIQGTGDYSALVNGDSALMFNAFRFVEPGGRPGHEGYFPITGFPIMGKTQEAIARLSGKPQSVSFEFRTRSGQAIQSFKLESPDADDNELLGKLTVPAQEFVVYAMGNDANGQPFQRVRASQFSPQSFAIVPPVAVNMGRGQDTPYIFQIKNYGADATFNFSALDDKNYQVSLTPKSADIPANGSADVRVVMHPPLTAAVGTPDTLTFTAIQSNNPKAINFAVVQSNVADAILPGDANRDGIVNCDDFALVKISLGSKADDAAFNPALDVNNDGLVDEHDLAAINAEDKEPPVINSLEATPNILWPANHKMIAVSVKATATDWCSIPPPVCKIVSVSSNESANGLGDGNTDSDWEVIGDLAMQLRAERSGQGSDRIYTANVQCTDTSGNGITDSVNITVPQSSAIR